MSPDEALERLRRRTRGASAATREDYEAFAVVWNGMADGRPPLRGDLGRLAERLGWNRATVWRWSHVCVAFGLVTLPEFTRMEGDDLTPGCGDHQPARVRWTSPRGAGSNPSWLACAVCRTPWPCDDVRGGA